MKNRLQERLIRYAKVETRSDANSNTVPSTQTQFNLAHLLAQELETIGMKDIRIEKSGNVVATLPSNSDKVLPTVGFIAHMDTADYNAENVNPQVVENYQGGIIVINQDTQDALDPAVFPNLNKFIGHTLITTDGTTLLGGDDKAGIAEIMSAVEYFIQHPEVKHGTVRVAFTIDEEIGMGAHSFDVKAFDADFAYTIDGGGLGELEYETFNGAAAYIKLKGVSVHPGTAKDTMINAITIARKFADRIPADEVPEKTDGRQGFYGLMGIEGSVEDAKLAYIIRDHDTELFNARKQKMLDIEKELNHEYGYKAVEVTLKDQYYNMKDIIEKDMSIVDVAKAAMGNLGITPVITAVRGGTDGSQLSFMGLPTPNLFTGTENMHGKFEFVSVDIMEKSSLVMIEIIKLLEEGYKG